MYLSNTNQQLEIVLDGTVTTNPLHWTTSYQDITSAGMTLPQASDQNTINGTTPAIMVASPLGSTNRQVVLITVFNNDTVAATVTIQKDVAGVKYQLTKALLQVGDSLMWSRESGWTINKQSTQESVIITEFTTSGTWTKPAGLKRVVVTCVGAGGGGGSGRTGIASVNRFGGGGGGGGEFVFRNIAASSLASTVTVTVGTGGTGGASQTLASTNGINGTVGGDTSFGSAVIAKGGNPGLGGSTTAGTAGTGGQINAGFPTYGPYALTGAGGSAGTTNTTSSAGGIGMNLTGAPGGAGGGGINSTGVAATNAGSGGSLYNNGVLTAGPTAGNSGVDNICVALSLDNSISAINGIGTGGAGGFPTITNPGNGGRCAGGGGGYAALDPAASGAGGNGGNGLCVVFEMY